MHFTSSRDRGNTIDCTADIVDRKYRAYRLFNTMISQKGSLGLRSRGDRYSYQEQMVDVESELFKRRCIRR